MAAVAPVIGVPTQAEHDQLPPTLELAPPLPSAENLGLLAVMAAQDREVFYAEAEHRAAELHAYLYEGYWHGLRITPPAAKEDQLATDTPVLVHSPGFGETIEDGVGAEFHDELAEQFPRVWMMSLAIDGVGDTGKQYGDPRELPKHSLARQAERKAGLVSEIVGDRPVVVIGTSMGSYKTMLMLNLEEIPDVIGGYFLSTAVVPKTHRRHMTVNFPLKTASDIVFNYLRSSPEDRQRMLPKRRPSWKEFFALAGHGLNMLKCTTEEEITAALGRLPIGATISGAKDAIAMSDHWERRAQAHGNFRAIAIAGAGHEFAANGRESAQILAKEIIEDGTLGTHA